jgi:hypothetical protein
MWLARCDYILRLTKPEEFESAMSALTKPGLAPHGLAVPFSAASPSQTGMGRFSAEHWVHSHPSVQPCDVFPGSFTYGYSGLESNNEWLEDLQLAPRYPLQRFGGHPGRVFRDTQTIDSNWFYSLTGRLFEWRMLHDTMPECNSWIWNYYNESDWVHKQEHGITKLRVCLETSISPFIC